jgi:CRP-like cAMP-binding protein
MDKKIPLFSLVEPSEMQELVSLLQPVSLEPGQVLFRENTAGDGMWILDEGAEVSISQTRGKRPVVIANNRGGESVGEMALIDGGPRSGAAVVTQGGSAHYISAANFRALRDAYRPAAFKVMRQLCKELCSRLRVTSDRISPSQAQTAQPSQPLTGGRRATEAEVNAFAPFQSLPKVVKLALCQKLQSVEIGPNQPICSEGDQGEHAFFLLSGAVRVTRNRKTLQQLGPGAMFGMVSVIDEGRRSATCVAEGPARLLSLSKRDFDNLFLAGNRFAFQMVDLVSRQLVAQLRSTNQLVSGPGSTMQERQAQGDALPEMLPLELEIELS